MNGKQRALRLAQIMIGVAGLILLLVFVNLYALALALLVVSGIILFTYGLVMLRDAYRKGNPVNRFWAFVDGKRK